MSGRTAPTWPAHPYSTDPHTLVEQLAAPAFDWVEEPIAAVADAFFNLITRHHAGDQDGSARRRGHDGR